ncbi:LITAF domain-containing protein-like [Ictalurus furcatus]|uniref:LITAF domain-containing protein-like n=1 Tax=Ictalurus furcatus TaxID=66913 RepID=UPI002350ABDC|nr:LITAF domain-containing protein-like [Ictalurus furcatus]
MAYIVNQPAPQAMYIEQAQPTMYIEQAQPPVIVQAAPQPSVAVVQAPGPVVIQSPMKSVPANTRCGFCQQQIVTVTRPVNGLLTWAVFGGLFLFFIWPFCLIPFCVKSCKDIEHTCPYCKNVIHVYKRM